MLTPTPPKTPPPRRLLEPQLKEAEEGAAFLARRTKFERDMMLGQEDMDLLRKLNREVADLIMSEPPMADTSATRERCRARIRDGTMEDFLVQIKDLEDDRALDEETSDGLRHLPRDIIEAILKEQNAYVDIELEIQRLVKLRKEANVTSARKAQKANVAIPYVIPEDKTTAKEKTIEQISSGSEDSKASKEQASKKPASSVDAPKAPKATQESRQQPKWAHHDPVAGLIARHRHSERFKSETRRYVEQLQLPRQVVEILQMLTSSVASGIMQVCRSSGSTGVQEIMEKVNDVNPEVAQLGTNMLSQDSNSSAYAMSMWWSHLQQYPPGYPYYWNMPWHGMHPKHRKKPTGSHKDKTSKKKVKKEKEKTKEKRDKKNKGSKRKRSSSSSSHSSTRSAEFVSKQRRRAAHRALRECEGKPRAEDCTEEALRRRFDALKQDRRPRPSSFRQRKDPINPAPLDPAPASLSPLVEDAALDDPYLMIDEANPLDALAKKKIDEVAQVPSEPAVGVPSEAVVSAADASAEMRRWLMGLDSGKGAFLEYLPEILEQYGNLHKLSTVKVKSESNRPLDQISQTFWEECGITKLGHKLVLAKGIIAL